MDSVNRAAKYYLIYIGKNATEKQIKKLMNWLPAESIMKLAKDRGFEE